MKYDSFRKTEQPLVMEGYCKYCVLNIQLPVDKGLVLYLQNEIGRR